MTKRIFSRQKTLVGFIKTQKLLCHPFLFSISKLCREIGDRKFSKNSKMGPTSTARTTGSIWKEMGSMYFLKLLYTGEHLLLIDFDLFWCFKQCSKSGQSDTVILVGQFLSLWTEAFYHAPKNKRSFTCICVHMFTFLHLHYIENLRFVLSRRST